MRRRPRPQAVLQTEAPARPARSPRARGPVAADPTRMGCGWLAVLGFGMSLIVIGLAAVVSQPPPEPTPTPIAGPLPIAFGYALDPETHLVTAPGNRFEHGDPFAYSVNPPNPPGAGRVYVEVVRRSASGDEVLQPPSPQALRPNATTFGFQVTADDLIALFGYGRFIMRIYLEPDGPVYAQGRFELQDPGFLP